MQNKTNIIPDLVKEQAGFVVFLEQSIDPELLDAVERAYHTTENDRDTSSSDISYEGTTHA